MSAHNGGVPAGFGVTSATTILASEFIFLGGWANELRITTEGVKYLGEFVQDAGEVYRALNDVMNGKPLTAPVAQTVPAWRGLNDLQWMNIVNYDRAYYGWNAEEAVHHAVKATEAKLKELNSAAPVAQAVPVAGEWVSVDERLPELKDDSVLAYFPTGAIDMVHIQDYFAPITNGVVDGEQQYTCWYLKQGVTHWQALPPAPGSAK